MGLFTINTGENPWSTFYLFRLKLNHSPHQIDRTLSSHLPKCPYCNPPSKNCRAASKRETSAVGSLEWKNRQGLPAVSSSGVGVPRAASPSRHLLARRVEPHPPRCGRGCVARCHRPRGGGATHRRKMAEAESIPSQPASRRGAWSVSRAVWHVGFCSERRCRRHHYRRRRRREVCLASSWCDGETDEEVMDDKCTMRPCATDFSIAAIMSRHGRARTRSCRDREPPDPISPLGKTRSPIFFYPRFETYVKRLTISAWSTRIYLSLDAQDKISC